MKLFAISAALKLLMPLLLAFIVPPVMAALKRAYATLDKLPAEVQRGVVLFLSGLGTALTTFLGVQITGDPSQWDSAALSTLITAAISFAIHAADKAKNATPPAA